VPHPLRTNHIGTGPHRSGSSESLRARGPLGRDHIFCCRRLSYLRQAESSSRRSCRLESVLPLLYLHGLSSGDFRETLPALLGPEAAGLSSSAILRLTKMGTAEYEAFRRRDLADRDYVYLWADGVHFIHHPLGRGALVHAGPDRGAAGRDQGSDRSRGRLSRERGKLAHGPAGSQAARAAGARAGRGRRRPGFWAAVRDVWPETAEQRCWVHRIANVLDKLPKSLQPRAKQALHEIMYAETRAAAAQGSPTSARRTAPNIRRPWRR
jgi:putative transposase